MFTIEDIYAMEGYLNNLLMVTLAQEHGIDVKGVLKNKNIELGPEYGWGYYYPNGSFLFLGLAEGTFDKVDYFEAEDTSLDKMYWYQKINNVALPSNSSIHLMVIHDDTLHLNEPIIAGDGHSCGAKLIPVENGIVILMDEDYGDCNWTEVYQQLINMQTEYKINNELKECIPHEMAV